MSSTRPPKILMLPLIILLLLLTNAFTIASSPAEALPECLTPSSLTEEYSGPDYAFYENYDQVDKHIDTLIVGDVIKEYPAQEIVTGHATNTITGEDVPVSYTFAVFDVKVSKTIKGSYSPGDTIKVKQLVLTGSNIIYFKEGERHIFFLHTYGRDVPASTISVLQGDILIVNGKTKRTNGIQLINDNVREDVAVKALSKQVEMLKTSSSESSQWEKAPLPAR